jgi:hypothetical protein
MGRAQDGSVWINRKQSKKLVEDESLVTVFVESKLVQTMGKTQKWKGGMKLGGMDGKGLRLEESDQ